MYLAWSYEKIMIGKFETTRDVIINYIDIPFYVLFGYVFLKWLNEVRKRNHNYLSKFQIFCTFGCLTFLTMILVNVNCQCIKLDDIFFWGNFIIFFTFFTYGVMYLKIKIIFKEDNGINQKHN